MKSDRKREKAPNGQSDDFNLDFHMAYLKGLFKLGGRYYHNKKAIIQVPLTPMIILIGFRIMI